MTERNMYKFVTSIGCSALWELKMSKTTSIPFSALKEHQEGILRQSKTSTGVLYKFPDVGVSQMACDGFWINNAKYAWVILIFYKIRKPKTFLYIEIDTWIKEREQSERKSLTEHRAIAIAERIITA